MIGFNKRIKALETGSTRIVKFYGVDGGVDLPEGVEVGVTQPGVVLEYGRITFFGEVNLLIDDFNDKIENNLPILILPDGFEVSVYEAPSIGENHALLNCIPNPATDIQGILIGYLDESGLIPYKWANFEPDLSDAVNVQICLTGVSFLAANILDELP